MAAVLLGRRVRPERDASGPGLGITALVALVLGVAYNLMPQTWPGFAGSVVVLVIAGVLVARASRTRRWSPTHVAIVGATPLFLTAALAFTYDPMIGEVTAQAKYAHNAVMVAIVLLALLVAVVRRQPASSGNLPEVGDDPPPPSATEPLVDTRHPTYARSVSVTTPEITLDNQFATELSELAVPWQAVTVTEPRLLVLDDQLATELGLDPTWLGSPDGLGLLTGNRPPAGATPVAQAYVGTPVRRLQPAVGGRQGAAAG